MHRYKVEGVTGLVDRSSRPHTIPTHSSPAEEEEEEVAARRQMPCGPARISQATGAPERTVARILHRLHEQLLAWCDAVTWDLIRAQRASVRRYEREHPDEPVHVDVMKLGRIPDGGGWRALGHQASGAHKQRKVRTGFDYMLAVIDDHSRLAYVDVLPDEKGAKAAAFLPRAADFCRRNGNPTSNGSSAETPLPTEIQPRSSRTAPALVAPTERA